MIWLLPSAAALTLQQAVERAAEVNPNAVVAELEWRQARLDATEAWASLGPTPSASYGRTWHAGSAVSAGALSVSMPLVDAPAILNAAEQSAQSRGSLWVSEATTLDAQYAAATLYYSVLAGQEGVKVAREGESLARATASATSARVAAGLESELVGKSAEIDVLRAEADTASADAELAIARAALARALEQPIDELEPTDMPEVAGAAVDSPWLRASEMNVRAARLERTQTLLEVLPTGELTARSPLPGADDWSLALEGRWSFDGLIGPIVRARSSALAVRIAEVQYDGMKRDIDLGIETANEQVSAAKRLAAAGRAREDLSREALQVGQTRLAVGLASSLEVLRLQDEAAIARADRVAAELAEVVARLEARRLAGVRW